MLRKRGDDGAFRLWTGLFALLVALLVFGIGFELWRHSLLPIEKFGLGFWTGTDWDPVQEQFGQEGERLAQGARRDLHDVDGDPQ